ncbi:glycosyltransferase family 4 protein [Ornithinibacillus halophilus]|uniref:UDP-GlcNAc:undecaprenyl-phosphate GlcNAc-1-phosphate transferase n=1 Tax=Ornithinibacillus halophilus TaxID=930117 RepID=A0A1M5EBJ1_9BACI|nr:MraY family glycosyltransferase [Ornithinibacillus halophilus]SHF76633.1 UDP-GlcNAc:undecaprenyl-phosphate GlcNAc-1-phosphate transferase [Ornithinibacillus halophilus]
MDFFSKLLIAFLISLLSTWLLTYPIKKLSVKFGVVDFPNYRKIHTKVTPRLGGLAIFLGALIGSFYLQPSHEHLPEIFFGAVTILITGILDDKYNIRPVIKLTGQIIAASFLISGGLIIEQITLPIIGVVPLGFLSVLITVLWIVGITNAINLIDGLDGLATGVSTIALTSLLIMAIIDSQLLVAYLCIVLIGSNLGFLYHNFYPAKIYMGDTGSNFLGFMIAVVSILGLFKNVAIFSFVLPVIVLAVPIFDTMFSIIRRLIKRENIMMADKKHIHYQIFSAGFSHRKTVLVLYAISAVFGALAVLFSNATVTVNLIIMGFVLILLHILAEIAGVVMGGKKPVLEMLSKFAKQIFRRNNSS